MLHPPEWFVRGLELFDSGLHVRWGNAVDRWVVERDGYVTEQEIYYLTRRLRRAHVAHVNDADNAEKAAFYTAIAEEVISAKARRRVILYTKKLDRQIFETLMLRDIQRYGGYARAIIDMENAEIAAQKDLERQQANHSEALHKEFFDQIQFIERKKSTEMLDGRSWKEMLTSGRSTERKSEVATNDPAPLGEFTVVDKRTIPTEVTV